jgi:uncharacterized membrane protein YbhN (UPF0104 family)
MQDAWRTIESFLRERVNWHRVGVALGLTVTVVALYVLYELLRNIDWFEVIQAIKRTEPLHVLLAALFVAAGYLTLIFYDYFALRSIGRGDVPFRVAAMAGFCSYSIGHNVGFSLFSGGTVRYRIYSTARKKLSALDVAKICFIAGLTFWLGNVTVLGLGFMIHPEAASAVDQLPAAANLAFGIALLALLAAYVTWVSIVPRKFGYGGWSVTLPGGRLTLLQILIGAVDLGCCAAAMYMVMPPAPDIDFISLAVIFVTATLLGFASHTPGGIGVFDATMLIALGQFDREELVGALLLFRLLYYITPFALALGIMAWREFVLGVKPPPPHPTPLEAAEAALAQKPRSKPPKRRPRRRAPSTAA